MKVLLVILLLTAVLAKCPCKHDDSDAAVGTPAIDFVKGFLEGIGEKGDINKLLQCLKDLESIFEEIKEALEHLKHMNIQEIIKGVTLLIDAVHKFIAMIKPCTDGFEVIKKLIAAMAHPDIKKIAMHIMMHPAEFIHDITEAIGCFTAKDYHCIGKDIGDMLRLMFLTRQVGNEAVDFLKGFLEGLGEQGDINKLLQCLKDLESIFAKFKEALEHLKKMKIDEIIKGLTILFEAVTELMSMLKPCAEGFNVLKRLIEAISHPDIKRIAMKIIMHPAEFIHDITSAISCFGSKDYHCAGKAIGDMLRIMFLSRAVGNDALDFMKGFLEGIGEQGDINKLLQCLKDLESIFAKLKEALEHLKHMKLEDIIKGLTLLFTAVRELMEMLKPCSEGFDKIKKLIAAIAHPDIKKIAVHILLHPGDFLKHVTEAIAGFGKKDFHMAGKGVGGLLKLMFL